MKQDKEFRRIRNSKRPSDDDYEFEERRASKKRRSRTRSHGRRAVNHDEGPAPPINTRRTQNAADKFSAEHQEKYEAHARRSDDGMRDLQRHCETCPALQEQIAKRRSDARATMPKSFLHFRLSELCHECRQITAREATQGRALPRTRAGTSRGVRKGKKKRKGLLKRLKRPRKRLPVKRNLMTVYRTESFSTSSSCSLAYTDDSAPKLTKADSPRAICFVSSDHSQQSQGKVSKEASKTARNSRVPSVASNNSVTTYHSFGSITQQPQV